MKQIIIALGAAAMLSLTACDNWLEVAPRTEMPAADLFKTQSGFRDALTGAYIRMKSTNIYGRNLTWHVTEFMAQSWIDNSATGTYAQLKNFSYTGAYNKEQMANIYETSYKVIADANGILQVIEDRKDVFSSGNYELIKGEALGLRAMCHFDLLRLFGPIPTNPSESGKVLPYVKTVVNTVHDHLTYDQFTQELLDDLDEAERLLAEVDPVLDYSIQTLNPNSNGSGPMDDNFLWYRHVRMNYYAVLALKARVYLWIGDIPNARSYANRVIKAKDPQGVPMFRLGTRSDMTNEDYTLTPEHIFSLYITDIANRQTSYFGPVSGLNAAGVRQFTYYVGVRYNNSTSDIRRSFWFADDPQYIGSYCYMSKYRQKATNPFTLLPLIRLSEMYLIAAETAETPTEGVKIYNELNDARGVTAKSFINADALRTELVIEYNREFWGEGQGFFAYKRVNSATIQWSSVAASPAVYIVPLPDREINYNNN